MCGSELKPLPEGVQRVTAALLALGHPHAPVMLDDAARTAQQAADALGIGVGQIAKSIIFRRKADDAAVLVVTSGDKRVDEKKVEALLGKLGRADAEFVKAATGFSIGGVAPLAHATPCLVALSFAIACSSCATSAPMMKACRSITEWTAARTSSLMVLCCA